MSNITLTGANADEFSLQGLPQFPATLGPGGAGAFSVTLVFTPAFQGNMHSAALHVLSDDPNLGPDLISNISGYGGDPRIATSVGTAAFGNLRVGLVGQPQAINIQNIGNSGLKIGQVVLGPGQGGNPNDFVLDAVMIPPNTVIPAMGELPISVSFKPGKVGQTSAQVIITSDDPNVPTKTITLFGNGTMAQPAVAPFNIDFGMQTIYLAGKPVPVVFTNMGNDAFSLTGVSFGGADKDSFRVSGIVVFPIKVAPNASVKIDLIALPLGLGTRTATVTFTTDDPMTPKFDIPLKANGVGASVKADPAYGDFGTIGGARQEDADIHDREPGRRCPPADRELPTGRPDADRLLPAHQRRPDAGHERRMAVAGAGRQAQLHGALRAAGGGRVRGADRDRHRRPLRQARPHPLSGAAAQAGIKIDPTMLNFGTVLVGNATAPQTVTVTNTGGTDLIINTVTLSGANPNQFHIEDVGKLTLAPGQSKVLVVSYQPVSPGTHSAALVVTPMGFAPVQVKLSGVAVQPILQVSTGQTPSNVLDFDVGFPEGNIRGIETTALQVGIKVPSNGIAVLIDRVSIAGAPEFRVEQPAMTSLSPGGTTSFSVFFKPSDTSARQATISIFVRGVPNALATVTVKGSALIADVFIPSDPPGPCSMGPPRAARHTPLLLLALPPLALLLRRRRRAAQ